MVPEQREIVEPKAKWARSMARVWTRNGGGRRPKNGELSHCVELVRASVRLQHSGNGPLSMVQEHNFLESSKGNWVDTRNTSTT